MGKGRANTNVEFCSIASKQSLGNVVVVHYLFIWLRNDSFGLQVRPTQHSIFSDRMPSAGISSHDDPVRIMKAGG